jgi:hypothetical protein
MDKSMTQATKGFPFFSGREFKKYQLPPRLSYAF